MDDGVEDFIIKRVKRAFPFVKHRVTHDELIFWLDEIVAVIDDGPWLKFVDGEFLPVAGTWTERRQITRERFHVSRRVLDMADPEYTTELVIRWLETSAEIVSE